MLVVGVRAPQGPLVVDVVVAGDDDDRSVDATEQLHRVCNIGPFQPGVVKEVAGNQQHIGSMGHRGLDQGVYGALAHIAVRAVRSLDMPNVNIGGVQHS